MTCIHQRLCYLVDGVGIIFDPRKLTKYSNYKTITMPCGKCIVCRTNKACEWSIRALHEMYYSHTGVFLTLTYDPDSVPEGYNLNKKDFQDFMKRLRRHLEYHQKPAIRSYFACGEYGEKRGRPHYHALIFGLELDDLKFHHLSYHGDPVYTSETISKLWNKGIVVIGTCSQASAGYVARYAKKACGFSSRVSPFFLASRNIPLSNGAKGALGAQWVIDYHADLLRGYILINGKKCPIPSYYLDLLERFFPDTSSKIKQKTIEYAELNNHNCLIFEDPLTKESNLWFNMCHKDEAMRYGSDFCGVELSKFESNPRYWLTRKISSLDFEIQQKLERLKRNHE